jgi:beta-glucosidase/6-phospho-beta-glucosidase/beta-galactosidase
MAILFLKTSYGEQRLPLFKSKVQSRMILKVHQFTIGLRIKWPGLIDDNTMADVADNHYYYYLYKQDEQRLKALGYKSYSLDISWSRTFPFGNGTVNHVPPPNLPVLDSDYRLPSDVMWGMAGAAFQVEGAVKADNKGPTFWDWASHKVPGFIVDNHTADVSDNH